ncbi:MAG: Gfo/Idh/MocA family oxidoreductase [Chloroflexota bacterium]
MKRLGMIGTGLISQFHLSRWQRLPVEIAGYYDINPTAAQKVADQYGGQVFESLEALLDAVDIVDVCTHTPAHKDPVLAAAAAGKDIVCEKPLARHLADCEAMVVACRDAGVRLFVAQVVRFFPQFAKAKAVLAEGKLGNPGVIRTIRGGSFPRTASDTWYNNLAESGGVIMDLSIHDIDYARWCFGEVERVFARGLTFANEDRRDHTLITLRFANGAIGHIEGSWAYPPGQFQTRIEMAGDEGLLEWDSTEGHPLLTALREDDGAETQRSSANPVNPNDDPYYLELKHFLECLGSGAPFRVTAHDGLMAVKISLAAIESMRIGQPVEIATFKEEPL